VVGPTFDAMFRATDRQLTVRLTTDAPRYAPGGDVKVAVTTRDRAGEPVPAAVVLRAVDEKLFTMGAAAASDPLIELYDEVGAGIAATYRSHRPPQAEYDGYGDTGGGGRDDFRDTVLFESVDTGADGRASVTFHLSDDLTSWHVSASAIGAGLRAGEGSMQIPVGLAFFADATIAPEYLVSDRPNIALRAFGTALSAKSRVTFAVDSDDLGLHVDGLAATAFETISVPLPTLTLGSHELTVTARTGSGDTSRVDRLTRTFTVVASRLARTRTTYQAVTGTTHLAGGDDRTEIVVSDAGVGRYVPLLLGLTDVDSARLERALAASVASSLARDRLDLGDSVGTVDFDGTKYQTPDRGLAILPFASSDLETTGLAALVAPDRFDRPGLRSYLSNVAGDSRDTRERRNYALAGQAGLGAPVLPAIRAAASDPGLTVRERLMLGLGAAALGDGALARSIAASLIDGFGESVADQARLRVGDSPDDVAAATALMAMLTASIGDPLAPRFWAYVEANPGKETSHELQAVGFVTRMLDHIALTPAAFAYEIGGKRTVVELDRGETFQMAVTRDQLASLTIEPISGEIGATTSWREPVAASAFEPDPDITIEREVTPRGTIKPADLVTVDLLVDLGADAPAGCHTVTDLAPSGLVPVGSLRAWIDPDADQTAASDATYPYAQMGQRVFFCAEWVPATPSGNVRLRYVARVVTAGTYTWEPAVVESRTGANRAALTAPTIVAIR
jgi:hypothetical protein